MAIIAVGDIHGNHRALEDLLSQIKATLDSDDTVVFLGDYIDRGPASRECIDCVRRFAEEEPSEIVTLVGNHEDWLLSTMEDFSRHSWILGMEAFPTIESYSGSAAEQLRAAIDDLGPRLVTEDVRLPYDVFLSKVPECHLLFLRSLRLFHRVGDVVCVHGGLDPMGGPVEEQDRETLI